MSNWTHHMLSSYLHTHTNIQTHDPGYPGRYVGLWLMYFLPCDSCAPCNQFFLPLSRFHFFFRLLWSSLLSTQRVACLASYATETVMQICHGRRRCSLTADSSTFGRPCKSDTKVYLKVVYTCGKFLS